MKPHYQPGPSPVSKKRWGHHTCNVQKASTRHSNRQRAQFPSPAQRQGWRCCEKVTHLRKISYFTHLNFPEVRGISIGVRYILQWRPLTCGTIILGRLDDLDASQMPGGIQHQAESQLARSHLANDVAIIQSPTGSSRLELIAVELVLSVKSGVCWAGNFPARNCTL